MCLWRVNYFEPILREGSKFSRSSLSTLCRKVLRKISRVLSRLCEDQIDELHSHQPSKHNMSLQSIRYVCRDCRLASKSASLNRSIPTIRRTARSFTSTSSQLKALATFTPTDRPVLDDLFAKWRSEVFLPSVISPHHQALIYKQSRKEILTTDPGVSVTVETLYPPSAQSAEDKDEEIIRLWPSSAFIMPNTSADLRTILRELRKSGSGKTWENIIPFLHGCQLARRAIPWDFREKLVKVANERNDGRWNTLVQAATYADSTGVTLAEIPFTTELILGLHYRAAQTNYSLDVASRKLFTQITVLLEDEAHCGSQHWKDLGPLYQDMRSSLPVLATQLAFSASKALQEPFACAIIRL